MSSYTQVVTELSGTNTKVEAVIVVIEMWVYCLYVLLAPAAVFTDDVYPLRVPSTTEWAVNNTQGPRDLHGMSTHNHGNDNNHFGSSDNGDHSYAKDHTHSNDSPSSATLSDHTLEDVTDSQLGEKDEVQNRDILSAVKELTNSMHDIISDIPKKVRSVLDVQNWKDTIYNYVDNKTREFAEKVRSVIYEEFYKLLDSMWEMINALSDSGK